MFSIFIFIMILIAFISKILNCELPMIKLMFLSIFTMVIGISIFMYSINIDSNISFYIKCISFIFTFYGISTGVQVLRRD